MSPAEVITRTELAPSVDGNPAISPRASQARMKAHAALLVEKLKT